MSNVVPGALWRPIDVGNRAARRKGRGLIGHIAVSNSALLIPGPLATRPSDWHFYLPKNPYPTGERFAQLIDLDLQSWSSAAGNATCPAFESEGGVGADVNGLWTANQVESAAIILAHLNRTEGVPLQDMVNSLPTSRGFGIHRYGIDPYRVAGGEKWSSVYAKACPGDNRAKQVGAIVARAQQIVNGDDDMAFGEAERVTLNDILREVMAARRQDIAGLPEQIWARPVLRADENGVLQPIPAIQELADAKTQAIAARAETAGLQTALAAVTAGKSVDLEAVAAAAKAGAEEALKGGVKVTVDVPGQAQA